MITGISSRSRSWRVRTDGSRYSTKKASAKPATKAKIKKVYPDWWHVRNPVDVWVAIEASGFEAAYLPTTWAVLEDEGVDAAVVILGAIDWMAGQDVPALFAGIKKDFPDKPVLAVCPLGDRKIYLSLHRGFQDMGISCYSSDEGAIAALSALYHYRQSRTGTD